jgi:hypothetical protein
MRRNRVTCLILALSLYALASCNKPGSDQVSSSGARQADPYHVPKNSKGHTVEQQNIYDRQEVTTDTTKVMWIHLIGLDGKIIRRMPVRNKVTSSGKRLEPTKVVVDPSETGGSYPSYNGYFVDELIQPDGTYGSSDPYIYWFDPPGRYHQWGTAGGLGYLVTDYPIDLENPVDKITGLYNADKAASQWQEEQEGRLRTKQRASNKTPPAEQTGGAQ